ncbi:elongation factor 1-beta [Stetteria hydrogenophila]
MPAKVAVIMKVFPSDPSVDPKKLKEIIGSRLPGEYKIKSHGVEPIAFGLKALKLIVEIPEESEGGTERLEELLKSIPEVSEVEVEAVHRLG